MTVHQYTRKVRPLFCGRAGLVFLHDGHKIRLFCILHPPPLVLSSYPVQGSALFRVGGAGALISPRAADALIRLLESPFIDDTYVAVSSLLVNPSLLL